MWDDLLEWGEVYKQEDVSRRAATDFLRRWRAVSKARRHPMMLMMMIIKTKMMSMTMAKMAMMTTVMMMLATDFLGDGAPCLHN